nr:immunoglobulin light chain junction region [Macaca mulatta]
FMQALDFPLTF